MVTAGAFPVGGETDGTKFVQLRAQRALQGDLTAAPSFYRVVEVTELGFAWKVDRGQWA